MSSRHMKCNLRESQALVRLVGCMPRQSPRDRIPNANNPRVLTRLL